MKFKTISESTTLSPTQQISESLVPAAMNPFVVTPDNNAQGLCPGLDTCTVSLIAGPGTIKGVMSGAAGSASASTVCPSVVKSCDLYFIGTSTGPIYNYGLSSNGIVSVISVW